MDENSPKHAGEESRKQKREKKAGGWEGGKVRSDKLVRTEKLVQI